MNKSSDIKRQTILESAKKRFAHFGMSKTTMSEIAKDISVSKALLYYYFPDKNSLYSAVMEYVIDEMLEEVEEAIREVDQPHDAMMIALEKRMELVNDYYNLFEYTYTLRRDIPDDLKDILKSSFEKELSQIARILNIGVESREYEVDNLDEIARLLHFSLLGIRMGVLKDMDNPIFPSKEDFREILNQQKEMVSIFLKGLKY